MAAGAGHTVARWLAGFTLAAALSLPLPHPHAQSADVDLALVLAVDCSFSVDAREFRLQMEGLGRALQREEIKQAIAHGPHQKIAIALVQWSDERNQTAVIPWTIIASPAEADAAGLLIAGMGRRLAEGGTSISMALTFSAALFAAAPAAERRVIDVSSDGRNNSGPPVRPARDKVVAQGVTINGITILNEWPTLDTYFEHNVVGGSGNFVMVSDGYEDYADAIYRKLLREITGPGIS